MRPPRGREALRERAVRSVELGGQDPDERLGTYSRKRETRAAYSEELAEQGADGTWRLNTYTGDRAYTLGITRSEVVVTVRIRLHPDVTAGDPETLKARWRDGIASVWNGKYKATNGRTTLALRFRPLFIPADERRASHHEVRVVPGPARSNESRWDTEDQGKTTAAHEFGHMVGARDEYSLPLKDDRDRVMGSFDETDSIMSGDYGRVQPRHLQSIREDLNRMRGRGEPEFSLEPG